MKNPNNATQKFLLSSIVPLIITGILCIFIENLPQKEQNKNVTSNQGMIAERNLEGLLGKTLEGYLYFISLVLVIHTFTVGFKSLSKFYNRKNHPSNNENESSTFKKTNIFQILKRMTGIVLQYTLAYSFWNIILLFIGSSAFSLDLSKLNPSSLPFQGSSPQVFQNDLKESLFRILEEDEENPKEDYLPMIPKSSPNSMASLSLAVGKVMGSLSLDACDIVLSKDENTAFVAIKAAKSVHIIDITNFESPEIIKTIPLYYSGLTYPLRSLKLSSDERYLFASTVQYLEIIDVTNLESPKILAQLFDTKAYQDHFSMFSGMVPSFYRISMAFSSDGNVLFVAGLGLQIFDVKNKSRPDLLNTTLPGSPNVILPATSLEISKDKKTMFYVNGTLNIFDLSGDSKNPETSYSCLNSIKSFALLKDSSDVAFITCLDENKYSVIQKLNLSNPFKPKALKTFKNLDIKVFSSLMILTMTSQASHIFLSMDYQRKGARYSKLLVYDLVQEELLDNNKSLIPQANALIFSQDNQSVIAASQSQFIILELHLRYPNTETFSLTNSPISQFNISREVLMFELFSNDQKLLTIVSDTNMKLSSQLRIYNASEVNSLSLLTSFDFDQPAYMASLSSDQKRIYVVFQYYYAVYEIRNGSDIVQIGRLRDYSFDLFAMSFAVTSNEKTGFIVRNLYRTFCKIGSINFSNLSEISYTEALPMFNAEQGSSKLLITKDDQVLLVISQNISVYNISDPSKITKLSSTLLIYDGAAPTIGSCKLSVDDKILLIVSTEGNFYKLRIYNMEKMASPEFQSEFILPQLGIEAVYKAPPIFSFDMKRVYILLKQSLLMLDISDLKKPQIAGVIPLAEASGEEFIQFTLSSDNKLVFVKNQKHEVKAFSLETKYTLFLHKESFPLGQKYTDEVIFFKLAGAKNNRYLPMDQGEYRVLKVTTLDIKIVANEDSPQMIGAHFPYWMSFDKENSMITIEPKQQRDLGIYTLLTSFSNRVALGSLQDVMEEKNMNSTVEDLVTTLISLGYLDNQLFLTANFGSMENFFLTSQFSSIRGEVYNLLKSHYIETCTSFKIVPSLELTAGGSKKIQIASPSWNSFKVEIWLQNNRINSHALFVNRNYGSLRPLILEKKDRLIIEGSLKEIDNALDEIVVDLENITSCAGTMTVSDHLNPPITKTFENISAYFEINGPPIINPGEMNIQEQINLTPIFTGEYFALTLNESAFQDKYVNVFSYELISQDKNKVPTWLNFNHLNLKGTPPEELFERDFFFYLIVRNEFQQLRVPFRLHIKISAIYVMKLVVKFSPYILTLIGLTVSANRIYNILCKNRYRHLKKFVVKVGDEINSLNNILPILFVAEGNKYFKLIWKYLKKYVAENLGSKSLSKKDFVEYFLKEDDGVKLDKVKIIQEIENMLNSLDDPNRKSFRQYFTGPETTQNLAIQLVINQIIMLQIRLKSELETLKMFEKIRDDCIKCAIWNPESRNFEIDEMKFIELLREVGCKGSHKESLGNSTTSMETSLLSKSPNINMDLLRNALIAHVFKSQSVNLSAIQAQVIIKQKVAANFIMTFLKNDLKEINVNSKFKVDYGINCQLKNDLLTFSGTVEPNFKGKNLVVQIATKRQKIMKELWIYEENCYWLKNDDYGEMTNVSLNSSGISGVQSYEIL